MPIESPPRNTRGAVRLAWGVSALVAIAAWAVGCGEPQPPVATGRIPALTVEVGNTGSVDLAAYFSDADGDVLTYTAGSSDPAVATVAVSGATVRVTAVAAGNATVTVTASDPGGLSADQTFAVTVPNRAPVAVGRMPDAETFVGESFETALAGYFSDPDGDALTYAATSTDSGIASVSVSGATLRVAGAGQGDATVAVTASDPGGLSATQTFSVTVPNRGPVAVGEIDDMEIAVESSDQFSVAGYFSDPDGDALSYSATSSNTGVATVAISGDTVAVTGVAIGSAEITVTASDGSLSASQDFTTAVVLSDRQVLEILYDSLDGDNWYTNTNWKSTAPLNDWHGIRADASGRVWQIALFNNGLTGSIPAELGDLGNLLNLYLFNNGLTGSIPAELGDLSSLVTLSLNNNDLTGSIPAELGDLGNLATLRLYNNDLTGSIPAELGGLGNLATLLLHNNDLTGSIPAELGGLGNLATLRLNDNGLAGSIPAELGDLGNLATLYLNDNGLTGSIPAELGDLGNLVSLYLNDNGLTGSIPAELGDLGNLATLYLNDNGLTDSIPAELGDLSSLATLYLNNNAGLTGELPSSFSGLTSLETFWAFGTDVCVPHTLWDWYEDIDNHWAERCDFNMDLAFTSAVSSAVREDVRDARDKWEMVLKDTEFTSWRLTTHRTCLGVRIPAGTVDDHVMGVHVTPIDGKGGFLAVATYCFAQHDGTPLISAALIDEDDLEQILDEDVLIPIMFHEMGHGLGFPDHWFNHDLVDTLDASDPHFEGELAIEAFDDAGGDDYDGGEKVPIQRRTFGHWRESVFGDEIMSPAVDLENDELPVSAITLQSFADIGYTVDVSQADDYELPEAEAHQHRRETGRFLDLSNDLVRVPIVVLDIDGRVVRVIPVPDGTVEWTPPWGSQPTEVHLDERERARDDCRECDG